MKELHPCQCTQSFLCGQSIDHVALCVFEGVWQGAQSAVTSLLRLLRVIPCKRITCIPILISMSESYQSFQATVHAEHLS